MKTLHVRNYDAVMPTFPSVSHLMDDQLVHNVITSFGERKLIFSYKFHCFLQKLFWMVGSSFYTFAFLYVYLSALNMFLVAVILPSKKIYDKKMLVFGWHDFQSF